MKLKKRILRVVLLGIMLLFSFNVFLQAGGITLSPSLIHEDITKSDNYFFTTITNNTSQDKKVSVYMAGLSMSITGSTIIRESKTEQEIASKIFNLYPSEFILKSGESKEVKIEVNLEQANLMSHFKGAYGVVIFEAKPIGGGGMVTSIARIAAPIWVKLPGLEEKSGELTGIIIRQNKPGEKIRIANVFKNMGNVHFVPQGGTVIIRDERGIEVKRIPVKPNLVMPQLERYMYGYLSSGDLPVGEYSAESMMQAVKGLNTNTVCGNFSMISPGILAQPKAEIPNFSEVKVAQNKPINFSFLFTNTGNVQLGPKINLEIKDIENNLITTIPIVSKEIGVGSSEEFEGIWEKGLPTGDYQAIVNAEYSKPEFGGIKKSVATAKISVIEKELVLKGGISNFAIDSIKSGEAVVPQLFFKNTGNTEFSVEGLIELKNSAGKTVGQIPVNKIKLAEKEEKRLGMIWSGTLPVGLYKAVVTLIYGGDKIVSGEASFLVK